MAKRSKVSESVYEPKPKRTSIGRGTVKMSSMNKNRKRTYKKYNKQG